MLPEKDKKHLKPQKLIRIRNKYAEKFELRHLRPALEFP